MFSKYTKSIWMIGVILAAMISLTGCHGGETSNDTGGSEEPTLPTTTFSAAAGARDGTVIEFSEAMDTASVEANLHIVQGDYSSADADISKAVSDGDEIDDVSFIWSGNTKLRLRWPARYGADYTIFVDTSAMTETGVNLAERVVGLAQVEDNPYDFIGSDNMADLDLPDYFILDNEAKQLPTFLVMTYPEITSLIASSVTVDMSKAITLSDYWYYSNAETQYSSVKMGRLDGESTVIAARLNQGQVQLFRQEPVDDETKMGSPSMILGSDLKEVHGWAPLGDLNADGYPELIFAGVKIDGTLGLYLVPGASGFFETHGETPATDQSLYQVAYETSTIGKFSYCGKLSSLASDVIAGGDFDGDGYDDFALCYVQSNESKADVSGEQQSVHIYHGAESFSPDLFGSYSIVNIEANSSLTLDSVIAADINGDMVDDIIVPYFNKASVSKAITSYDSGMLVFFGEKDVRASLVVPTDADVDIKLGTATDIAGRNVGDINADGFEDMAVVITDVDLVSGNPTSRMLGIKGQAAWNAVINTEDIVATADCTGMMEGGMCTDINALGDVDNDGYDDMGMWINIAEVSYMYYLLGGAKDAGSGEITAGDASGFKMMGGLIYR